MENYLLKGIFSQARIRHQIITEHILTEQVSSALNQLDQWFLTFLALQPIIAIH